MLKQRSERLGDVCVGWIIAWIPLAPPRAGASTRYGYEATTDRQASRKQDIRTSIMKSRKAHRGSWRARSRTTAFGHGPV